MSEQKMCFVPTEDGEVEVPVGTLIWLDGGLVALADEGGWQWDSDRSYLGDGCPFPYGGRTAVIIAIPDSEGGWTVPDATKSEWVPLTEEQVAALPDRTPVRVEGCGVVVEGLLHREETRDGGVSLHNSGSHWWVGSLPHAVVHVHSEDVPADPNTDLVERMAKAAYEDRYYGDRYYGWDQLAESSKDIYRQQARSAPAAVREEK